jgi:DNA-binding NarL/FixJ family response regulator
MEEPIRVIVADDHPLFRGGVIQSLAAAPDITVLGEAESGAAALRLARDLLPDVLLLDIAMPGNSGITTAAELATACPATKVIMLTMSEREDDLLAAFKAGARGYVLKGVSARELIEVVRMVARGEVYVSPVLAGHLLRELSQPRTADPLAELTEREREMLRMVAAGLTNREIGEQLHLAEKTIKHYMTNILGKLHVRSRVEAAMIAAREAQHLSKLECRIAPVGERRSSAGGAGDCTSGGAEGNNGDKHGKRCCPSAEHARRNPMHGKTLPTQLGRPATGGGQSAAGTELGLLPGFQPGTHRRGERAPLV